MAAFWVVAKTKLSIDAKRLKQFFDAIEARRGRSGQPDAQGAHHWS